MNNLISKSIGDLSLDAAPDSRRALVDASLETAAASRSVFTRLYPEAARAAASHADALHAAGVEPASKLAGLPVSIKDLLDVAGEATLAGSTFLKDSPPALHDAPVVHRLRQAGAAIIGKTNMTEFAFSGLGLNPHHGTPANPVDAQVARTPGGSSSGAAVSVAAGMCVAAVGSDTGGSIRIPAAFCGLVGFKSTARRVPTTGVIPLSTTLDTLCALSHSVTDCIIVDNIIADDKLTILNRPLAGLRLAVPTTVMLDGLDQQVAHSFTTSLKRLSAAGAIITEYPFSPLAELADLNRFSAAEAFAWHRHFLQQHEAAYDSRVSKRIKLGAALSAADYIDLHTRRRDWIRRMEALMQPYDALIMPTVPIVAPTIAELEASEDTFFKINGLVLRNPSAINFLDGCAISIPCHAPGSLPTGLMIAGAAMTDGNILSIALAIEAYLADK